MNTMTRELLLIIQQWRETYGPGSNVVLPAEEAEELARIALSSLEAEPVAYIRSAHNPDGFCFADGIHPTHRHQRLPLSTLQDGCYWKVTPLYAAPLAPVSMKDHQIRDLVNELRGIAVKYHGAQQLRERIARAVRAAVQSKANGVLTNEGTIPATPQQDKN